jgi:hypothetical protein
MQENAMAAAQVVSFSDVAVLDQSERSDRQAMIDSVLGTMGAEGEPPSKQALAYMQSFIEGNLTLDEMSEAILAHARRMVDEAHTHRLAIR